MEIYGVEIVDQEKLKHPFWDLANSPEGWRTVFEEALHSIATFLAARDPFEILAKTSSQLRANVAAEKDKMLDADVSGGVNQILTEVAEVEILQALALMQTSSPKMVPASPGNLERFIPELTKSVFAFSRMQKEHYPADDERENVIRKVRLHTVYARNSFLKSDCETVVPEILRRFDHLALRETGFRFSDIFSALIFIGKKIENRFSLFVGHWLDALQAKSEKDVLSHIRFYCGISPVANRAWSLCRRRCTTLQALRWATFQLSELCNSWIYTLEMQELRDDLGGAAVTFFGKIAIRPGELADANPEHFFMNNPIWRRPFVALGSDKLFLALPNLFYAFPFRIFEQFIPPNSPLQRAYSDARSAFLEESIHSHVASGMPSGKTYRRVMWHDKVSDTYYENDVVAIVGNTIFLFEAKSGRLDDAARRGGGLRLLRTFKELFVEPGEQAARLESYINAKGSDARLWLKDTGEAISLDLETRKVVHKFSVCIENFASLTSAKYNLKALGAINNDDAWAPVLSLGELMLVWRCLDTEISLFHYLTRRATLEELIDFEGDEQDILAMYLINGLCIDSEQMKERQLQFVGIDAILPLEKVPRQNRKEFEVYGVPLSGYWKSVLEEIYSNPNLCHRFDFIQVVLNQDPHGLASIEQLARKWKRGLGGVKDGDVLFSRFKVGKRVYVLAYHLLKTPIDPAEWIERSRNIAGGYAFSVLDASDCALFLRIKKSKEWTYDGLSFHRFMAMPRSEANVVPGDPL